MSTLAKTPRTTTITLADTSSGPFILTFRLFDTDAISVYRNGAIEDDFTLDATFADGYTDSASITLDVAGEPGDVIVIDSDLTPHRAEDYLRGDPAVIDKINNELGRLWSAVADVRRTAGRSLRSLQDEVPIVGDVGQSIILGDDGFTAGPTADQISAAQGYAEFADERATVAAQLTAELEAAVEGIIQGGDFQQLLSDVGVLSYWDLPFTPASTVNVGVVIAGITQLPDLAYARVGRRITFAAPVDTKRMPILITARTNLETAPFSLDLDGNIIPPSGGVGIGTSTSPLAFVAADDAPLPVRATGAVADGTANDTSALAGIASGRAVDLGGRTIKVDALPTDIQCFNGAFNVGGVFYAAPPRQLAHPLDGDMIVTDGGGASYQTGPIWYEPATGRLHRVFTMSSSHLASAGGVLYYEYSNDLGASWEGRRSIFSHNDYGISAMVGGVMGGGQFGLFLRVWDAAANTGRHFTLISTDAGATWTRSLLTITPSNFFPYGQMHNYPTVAGGHDTNGWIIYGYESGTKKAYAVATVDNGATWTSTLLHEFTTEPNNPEVTVARVGKETKWLFYFRPGNSDFFYTATSVNMTTLAGVQPSNIENDGLVGQPPELVYSGGRFYLYIPYRPAWSDEPRLSGSLVYYTQEATSLYAAGGIFTSPAPHIANVPVSRNIGMLVFAETPYGLVCQMRIGETEFASHSHPVASQIGIIAPVRRAMAAPYLISQLTPRRNLIHNGEFWGWDNGISFSMSGSTNVLTAERWKFVPSGGTFNIDRAVVDDAISRVLPWRPRYGMQIASGAGEDYSGFCQDHYGEAVRRFSNQRLTFSVYGIGAVPSPAAFRVLTAFYTSGGSSLVAGSNIAVTFSRPEADANGIWQATAVVNTFDAGGVDLGADPVFRMLFDCGAYNATAWVTTILGVKCEFGDAPTWLEPADPVDELLRRLAHFETVGNNGNLFGIGYRETTTLTRAPVDYTAKVRTPSLTFVGTAGNLTFDNVSGAPVVTAVAFENIGRSRATVALTTDSTTGYTVGMLKSNASDTYIKISAEG